jgi:hypothetical protein
MNRVVLFSIVSLPLVLVGAAPIALNGGGGGSSFAGGSFASVSTGGTGCSQYAFSSESDLGFGRAAEDEWCIGTSTSSNYVSVLHNSSKTQLQFNKAPSTSAPHLSEIDNTDDGFNIGNGTDPFSWVVGGTTLATLGMRSGRSYLCFGAWNTNGVPCFTSDGTDFVMYDSDGSSFSGSWDVGSSTVFVRAGSAAAPSIYFDGDSNTGIFRIGADELGVSIGGTSAGRLAGTGGESLKPAAGYYLNISELSGAPSGTCSGSSGLAALQYDYTNHRFYVCNDLSTTRSGWDYADLTD